MNTDTANFAGHTPGPWFVSDKMDSAGDCPEYPSIRNADGHLIAHTFGGDAVTANTRLMHTSMDLLRERNKLRAALEAIESATAERGIDGLLKALKEVRETLNRCGK